MSGLLTNPRISLYIAIAVTIEQAIGGGTVLLTDAVPAEWIPFVKSWCLILAFVGSTILTIHLSSATTDSAKLDSVAALSRSQRNAAFAGVSDDTKLRSVEAMRGVKSIVPETGATGAVAAAVDDPDRPKVIDADPAPPSSPSKPTLAQSR